MKSRVTRIVTTIAVVSCTWLATTGELLTTYQPFYDQFPSVSGDRLVGATLTCVEPTWFTLRNDSGKLVRTDDPVTLAITWLRDDVEIPGSSGVNYTATIDDLNHKLRCKTVATSISGQQESIASDDWVPKTLIHSRARLSIWVQGKRLTRCGDTKERACLVTRAGYEVRASVSPSDPSWEFRKVLFDHRQIKCDDRLYCNTYTMLQGGAYIKNGVASEIVTHGTGECAPGVWKIQTWIRLVGGKDDLGGAAIYVRHAEQQPAHCTWKRGG